MTDVTAETSRQPLGVGRIIGDTFSIFFRKLPAILVLGLVPSLLQIAVLGLMAFQSISQIAAGGAPNGGLMFLMVLTSGILSMVAAGVVAAAIVQLAFDAKLDRPARYGRYIAVAVRNLPALTVLAIVAMTLGSLGFALLIVPGLWIFAVFSVFVPAIVIDGSGFGALGRSAGLTRHYRWPIVLALILVVLCMYGIMMAFMLVNAVVFSLIPGVGGYVSIIVSIAMIGSVYGLISVSLALIFARLKEIKEGVGVADLVEVFK